MDVDPQQSADLPSVLADLCGTVLEQRYQIVGVLGAGGMGAVFEARHLRLDRPVAIKVLKPALAGEREYNERFLREAKSATKIRHRNVVEILDYGETAAGLLYSVMEFLVGQDLEQVLGAETSGRLPWARACGLLVQIASGLRAAHREGVIHRDIKPANCFVTVEDDEPLVKLVDFGIAKLEGAGRGPTLTGTAQVLGTPSYIAPELVRTTQPASPHSDIYSLGVVAYRMLTGRVPFDADTVFELLRKACFDPVRPLRPLVPELSPAVEGFVLELLAKDPRDRPKDMDQVRRRLLALSRETLGAQAVEIPGSSALAVGGEGDVPRPIARAGTQLAEAPSRVVEGSQGAELIEAMRGSGLATAQGGSRVAAVEVEAEAEEDIVEATTLFEPAPATAARPTGPPVAPTPAPAWAPVASPSPPRTAVASARSGWPETIPGAGESTLSGAEASGAIARSGGSGVRWLGIVGLVAGIGALVGMGMALSGEASPRRAETDLAFAVDRLAASRLAVPVAVGSTGSADVRVGRSSAGSTTEGASVEAAAASESSVQVSPPAWQSSGSSESSVQASPPASQSSGSSETSEPPLSESSERSGSSPSESSRSAIDDEPVAAGGGVPPSKSGVAPAVDSSVGEAPRTRSRSTRAEPSTRPAGPPSDAVLVKRIQRWIKSRCLEEPGDGPVVMTFLVTVDGDVMSLAASPTGLAGQCAKAQVRGMKFRPRDKGEALKITVP